MRAASRILVCSSNSWVCPFIVALIIEVPYLITLREAGAISEVRHFLMHSAVVRLGSPQARPNLDPR
jgi:hypothetical protein